MQAGGVDIYFIHPDHLDTPRALVNANDQPIWLWDSAPFGDTAANEQPTAGIPNFTFNLRFPGQQYDRETGTHYNYHRDYEAGTGRYVQSDPIGLEGGFSSFSYGNSTPTSIIDPLGLKGLKLRVLKWWKPEEKAYGRAKINCLKRAAKDQRLFKRPVIRTGTAASHYTTASGKTVAPGDEVDHLIDLQLGGCETWGGNLFPTSKRVNRSFGAQIGNQLRSTPINTLITDVSVRRK